MLGTPLMAMILAMFAVLRDVIEPFLEQVQYTVELRTYIDFVSCTKANDLSRYE